jgi:hypothetical protein
MTESPHNRDVARFQAAIERFDAENAQDPNRETVNGVAQPRESLYAMRLTAWVEKLCPDASEELLLAARAQHLCRWMIPRDSYPMDRVGYLKWRETLKQFHATKAGGILREVGYANESVERVQKLILKKLWPKDAEACALEDALCLVFLETQFANLAVKTPEDRMLGVIRKTWKKMTPQARDVALAMKMSVAQRALIETALASE